MRHRRTAGLFVCGIFYSDRLTKCEKRLALFFLTVVIIGFD